MTTISYAQKQGRTVRRYTVKALAAYAGVEVQRTRLAAIDRNPGAIVPRMFPSMSIAVEVTRQRLERAERLHQQFLRYRADQLQTWEKDAVKLAKAQAIRDYAFPLIMKAADRVLHLVPEGDSLTLTFGKERLARIEVGTQRYSRASSYSGSWVDYPHVRLTLYHGHTKEEESIYSTEKKNGLNVEKIMERLIQRWNGAQSAAERHKKTVSDRASLRERVSGALALLGPVRDDSHYVRDWNGRGGTSYPYYKVEQGHVKVEVSASSNPVAERLHYNLNVKLTDAQMQQVTKMLKEYDATNAGVCRDDN